MNAPAPGHPAIEGWFAAQGWSPFAFQREVWRAIADGHSGLVHAPTGYGKTFAVWGGLVAQGLAEAPDAAPGPRVLWITPLRSLANDTTGALRRLAGDVGLAWTIERRTGDVASALKQRLRRHPPHCLVTTPESLSLLLSYPETRDQLASLDAVVVDEWHELLGTKRGVQVELALARLRGWRPGLRTWGVSATVGNIAQAIDVLLGPGHAGRLVRGEFPKRLDIATLKPTTLDHFPWGGHLGLALLPQVLEAIAAARSTLLFTNTRSQAELWHQAIVAARPEWAEAVALHHGSLDTEERGRAESLMGAGALRCLVCTSSMDLGVDFDPVEQVIQVGSPKGVARLLQRAGRSGHRPGATSRLLGVPTNTFEFVEYSAARAAAERFAIEDRPPLDRPLDVLAQHVVTLALGGGVDPEALRDEVRRTAAFAALSDDEWRFVLEFVTRGGPALRHYPQFARVVERDGRLVVESRAVARFHRLGIGTIASDHSVRVRTANGPTLGTVEESFVTRLRPGDRFLFAGRTLELVAFKDMTAIVRTAKGGTRQVPRWMGGKMPLSSQLARGVRERLDEARRGVLADDEMRLLAPVIEQQQRWSRLPAPDELLIEQVPTRDGHHTFVFPFAGRLAHEGLGPLLAWRLARQSPRTFLLYQNDYGLELAGAEPLVLGDDEWRALLSPEHLVDDLLACLNATELARHQFREVARVAGLVFAGYPGAEKTTRQVQASAGLLYDVLARFDPDNLLLHQARREVLDRQLDVARLRTTLQAIQSMRLVVVACERLTPLAFPLWAERIRETVSTEKWIDRVERMLAELHAPVSAPTRPPRKRHAPVVAG